MKKFTPFYLLLLLSVFSCKKDRLEKIYDDQLIPYEHVIVIDSSIFKLKSDSAQLAAGEYSYTTNNPNPSTFENKIIIGYTGEGYLRRVLSARKQGDQLILETRQATLEESFEKMNIKHDIDFGPSENSGKSNAQQDFKFNVPLADVDLLKVGDNSWVKLKNGNLLLDPNFTMDIKLNDGTVEYINFGSTNSNIALDYDLLLNLETDFLNVNYSKTLWSKKNTRVIWLGSVPVVEVTDIIFKVKLKGSLDPLNASTHIHLDRGMSLGIEYKNASWDPYFDYTSTNELSDFTYSNQIVFSAKLEVVPEVSLKLYGVAGPYLKPTLETNLKARYNYISNDKDIEASIKTYLTTGFKAELFDFFNQDYTYTFNGGSSTVYKYPNNIDVSLIGNNQTASAGSTLANQIGVKVKDLNGFAAPFVNVYFSIKSGNGSLSTQKVLTDITGKAYTNWTLGNSGTQRVEALIKNAEGETIDTEVFKANLTSSPPVPSCTDGIQNGTETAIDCGGSCSACPAPTTHTGRIWNMDGDGAGAWDMIEHTEKFLSDPNSKKDMANTTPIGTIEPDFYQEFKSLNQTKFVPINSSAYSSTLSNSEAQNLYNGGTPTTTVSNVQAGQYFVAKIRNSNTYRLIKITYIHITTSDDFDYIDFEYKSLL